MRVSYKKAFVLLRAVFVTLSFGLVAVSGAIYCFLKNINFNIINIYDNKILLLGLGIGLLIGSFIFATFYNVCRGSGRFFWFQHRESEESGYLAFWADEEEDGNKGTTLGEAIRKTCYDIISPIVELVGLIRNCGKNELYT